jgi:hypothetical protein
MIIVMPHLKMYTLEEVEEINALYFIFLSICILVRYELDRLLPLLEVSGPDGQQFSVELAKDRTTIGRFEQFNDVALEPDPQQLITRKVHCAIEHNSNGYWVVDNGSVNTTLVQKGNVTERVYGRTPISDGDSICILGRLTETSTPIYWKLIFRDPLGTRPAGPTLQIAYLEYDWIQAKLYLVDNAGHQEVRGLRPQEHKLIRYMDQRNRANNDVPVMCVYEELLTAIWGEESYHHTDEDVNHLIWEMRKKLEPDSKNPQLIETVRGLGYRLVTRPLKV